MDVRCAVQRGISLWSSSSKFPLSLSLPFMKSLILRLSYQPLMGEVSCGSHKGKWSYLYAGPTSRLQQKELEFAWTHFLAGALSREKTSKNIEISGCTLSWRGREILDTKGSLPLKWTGSEPWGSTVPWRTRSCRTSLRKHRTSCDAPRPSFGSTNPTMREAKWRWSRCKRRFVQENPARIANVHFAKYS